MGARPLAVTDNLNFGNPEKPEIMGEIVAGIDGIGEACRALDFPIVSGNCSLYNETQGEGILPTPTIGGVGLIKDVSRTASVAFKREGDAIILIGETPILGPSRPIDLSARGRRPRSRRLPAGRSYRRKEERRFRARPDRIRPPRHGA